MQRPELISKIQNKKPCLEKTKRKKFQKKISRPGVVAPARLFSQPSGGRGRGISDFEASLIYRESSRTARVSKTKKKSQA